MVIINDNLGLFLRRQKEVSEEFSKYISTNIITSQEVWQVILNNPGLKEFNRLVSKNIPFLSISQINEITNKLKNSLLDTKHILHNYTNQKLGTS